MTTTHEAYGPAWPEPFAGTRDELTPGAYLGRTARPDLMRSGDLVTCVVCPDDASGFGDYFYDPELRIEGTHYVRTQSRQGTGDTWLRCKSVLPC